MAENLIASLLVFYKETTAPLAKLPHVPPVFQEIQVYIDSACKDTTAAHLATTTTTHGSTTVLEQQPLKIARDRSILALSSTASLVDRLFYVIMNLTRPSMGYLESIEINAQAVFNIMVASMFEGLPTMPDCERLLILCIHLKDNSSRYPLRVLAINICFEILGQRQLPINDRKTILRFLLGPAEFVLHHLEWRISLIEKMKELVKENSYEDIEFRALVRRMANKLELETPTTQIEKDKARLYRFIELIILDPQKYATVDQVSKIMSKSAWWSDILRHDLVIYLYSHEFRPQMSLFSEILRIIGISYTPYVPVPVHSTLDENTAEFNAQVLIQIAKFKDTLVFNCFRELDQLQENISTFEGSGQQHELLLQSMFESAMALTLDGGKVILEMLESSTNGLVAALRDSNSGKVDVSSLFEMTQILARFVIVAPSRYLSRIMWMVANVQVAAGKLRQQGLPLDKLDSTKLSDVSTLSLDVWLSSLVYRREPRSSKSLLGGGGSSHEDFFQSLALFTCLFPADRAETWITGPLSSRNDRSSKEICSLFLQRLLGQLLPCLQRHTSASSMSDSTSTTSLLLSAMTCLMCETLSCLIPPEIICHNRTNMVQALKAIADVQRDINLKTFVAMQRIIYVASEVMHPFPSLEARLAAFSATECLV